MSKWKPKPAICYGAFVNLERIENLDLYADKMAVTKFTIHNGTAMAHGRSIPEGKSHHRKAESMRFFASEDKMNLAIEAAFNVAGVYDSHVEDARKKLDAVIRERTTRAEGALNNRAYYPHELEYLED